MRLRSTRASYFYQRGNAPIIGDIMALFRKNPPAKQTTTQSTDANVNPETKQPWAADDPKNPTNAGKPVDPATGKVKIESSNNPLDIFKPMFDTVNKGADDAPPAFNLDPEALTKIAGGLDFAGQLTPELLDKLKTGDQKTTQDVLNTLGRNVYATLMQHIPSLTDKFVNARLEHSQKGLGKSVTSTLAKQNLDKLAVDNPVLKKQLGNIGEELLRQYPDATPEWIAEQTVGYFTTIAKTLDPKLGAGDKTKEDPMSTEGGFDWGNWAQGKPQASKT